LVPIGPRGLPDFDNLSGMNVSAGSTWQYSNTVTPSWPGLSRPSTSYFAAQKDVDARDKREHDVKTLARHLKITK
jgi:hypothetical protein